MEKRLKQISTFIAGMVIFSACTKVIKIDLNKVTPSIVVEGSVSDQPGPYTIKLTQTVNYDQDNTFPGLSGAVVQISDHSGNVETLSEVSTGIYKTSTFQGVPGRTYVLSITDKGQEYSATSTMPFAVTLDSILVDTTDNFGFGGNNPKLKTVRVKFQDPPGRENYYRFIESVNGVAKKNIFITSDNLRDGDAMEYFLSRDTTILSGDSITVAIQSIDKNVYEYFRTLSQIAGGGGGLQASTPDNPTTNMTNRALGYFSAETYRKKTIKVP